MLNIHYGICGQGVGICMVGNTAFNGSLTNTFNFIGRRAQLRLKECIGFIIIYGALYIILIDFLFIVLGVIITINSMQVRLIRLLAYIKIFIQITAIVCPSKILEIIKPIVYIRIRTDWQLLKFRLQHVLVLLRTSLQFPCNASFAAIYC